MRYYIWIIIALLCSKAECKVDINLEILMQQLKENKVDEIYESTSKLSKAVKGIDQKYLKLYKDIYQIAIYKYNDLDNYSKAFNSAVDIYKSPVFNGDENFTIEITAAILNTLNKNSDCQQNSNFVLKIIEDGVLESMHTRFIGRVIMDEFIKSSMKKYELNSVCIVNYFSRFLDIEYKKSLKKYNYKTTDASAVTNQIFDGLGNSVEKSNKGEYLFLISKFYFKLINNKREDASILFISDIEKALPSYFIDDLLKRSEKNLFNFYNCPQDILFTKLKLLGNYLPGESWPFEASREDTISRLINIKFRKKSIQDFFLVVISDPALRFLRSTNSNEAVKFYRRILQVDPENATDLFGTTVDHVFRHLAIGFKLRAALSMGDLQSAKKIHDESLNDLYSFFSDPTKYKNIKYITFDVATLFKPYLEYEIFMKRNDLAKKLIELAVSTQQIDILQLSNKDYLLENKFKFSRQSRTFLYLLKDYYTFIRDEDSVAKVSIAIVILVPESYNRSDSYFAGMSSAINHEDKNALEFYLSVYKDNLINFRQEKTFPIFLDIYDILNAGLKSFPNETESEEVKLFWKKIIFDNLFENLGLAYFLDNSKLSYPEKLTQLHLLFNYWRLAKRNEEAYAYAMIYIGVIKDGITLMGKSDLSREFQESQAEKIEEIIDFFFEIDNLFDAKDAISVLKEQSFLEFIGRQGRAMRGLNSKINDSDETLITLKIKSLNAELALVTRRIDSDPSHDDLLKLNRLRASLTEELRKAYKIPRSVSLSEIRPDKNATTILDGHAYVDYFLKNGKLNIIYSSKYTLTKVTKSLDIKYLANAILDFNGFDLENNDKKLSLSASLIYDELFSPIESNLLQEKITDLHIRANSYLASIPLKYLINFKNSDLSGLNVIYQGISTPQSKRFIFSEKSSLFATSKRFPSFPLLGSTDVEINFIYDSYKSRFALKNGSRKFINQDFSFEKFVSEFSSNTNVVHIASHYSNNRINGGLLLGTGEVVSAKQIWNGLSISPNGKLVTISACESGLFNDQGQSMEDLPNVFLSKGASFVIATLWKISDKATADFMRLFYDILILSGDPPTALNLTQTSFAEGNFSKLEAKFNLTGEFLSKHNSAVKSYSKPFFWAGFQLIAGN